MSGGNDTLIFIKVSAIALPHFAAANLIDEVQFGDY